MADPARVTRRLPGAELERRRRGLVEAIEVVEVADDSDVPPDKGDAGAEAEGEGEVGVETGAAVVVCVSFCRRPLSVFFFFFCMKLIANLQDEKTPYGTKGDATQHAR
ncbi:BQ5605_C001g00302 [Microbotryum silenes-dioicae]|uniref:BQ5605_C001g00302 protein n=1 Tax=Microbotryum silenes-dioicae TaxID=796604 RepID=A0A2X0MQB5_9BASI|nr:BQ5605_C001g00302 [Microbotryum silenes-dioicae]